MVLGSRIKDISNRIVIYKMGVLRHLMARVVGLIAIPLILYLSWYSIHFAILNRDDLGQSHMSPAFRATLNGGKPLDLLAGKRN